MSDALENPIWHSLISRHRHLAQGSDLVRRYPAEIAPFVGAAAPTPEAASELLDLITPGERVGILQVIPPLGVHWQTTREIEIHQYVWPENREACRDLLAKELGEEHIPAMLELTALVYPAYFRAGTARLGNYVGILDGERLCAMAGIRMAMEGFQEISAICTHPDFRGRGLASRLTQHLVAQIQGAGEIAFLHTESDNPAKSMYEKLGFRLRAGMPFLVLDRL